MREIASFRFVFVFAASNVSQKSPIPSDVSVHLLEFSDFDLVTSSLSQPQSQVHELGPKSVFTDFFFTGSVSSLVELQELRISPKRHRVKGMFGTAGTWYSWYSGTLIQVQWYTSNECNP